MAITTKGNQLGHMGWKYVCFECGNTSHIRKECPVYLAKIKRIKENGKGKRIGNVKNILEIAKCRGNNDVSGGMNRGKAKLGMLT